MSGNQNQYEPSKMFKTWIQKNGQAQTEFIKNFSSLLNQQSSKTFNPLEVMKEISENAKQTQFSMMNGVSDMQRRGMEAMFNAGQMLPSFMHLGAYKTTISSNGRISIPEAERSALGLDDGDLVQVIILPIAKKSKSKDVKKHE